eukprot:7259040-Heterocapsa_arctica.AAC.1
MSSDIMWTIWYCSKKVTRKEAIGGLYKDLMEAKQKLTDIGQVLNDKRADLRSKQDRGNNMAPDQSRLQRQSRTSGYMFRNHFENAQRSQSQQGKE